MEGNENLTSPGYPRTRPCDLICALALYFSFWGGQMATWPPGHRDTPQKVVAKNPEIKWGRLGAGGMSPCAPSFWIPDVYHWFISPPRPFEGPFKRKLIRKCSVSINFGFSKFWPLDAGFRQIWPRIRIQHEKLTMSSYWLICYFQLFGKRFREDFWRFWTSFPGSFRSIFRICFREKIFENHYVPYLIPFKGP